MRHRLAAIAAVVPSLLLAAPSRSSAQSLSLGNDGSATHFDFGSVTHINLDSLPGRGFGDDGFVDL